MSKNIRWTPIGYTTYNQNGKIMQKTTPKLKKNGDQVTLIYYVYDGSGYSRQERHFSEVAFLNEWHKGNDTNGWLKLPEGFPWSITPSALKHPGREVRPKEGGWGGARHRGVGKAIDPLRGLRNECLAECRRQCSEAPYLRYEAEWERKNARKAPKTLYRAFCEDI